MKTNGRCTHGFTATIKELPDGWFQEFAEQCVLCEGEPACIPYQLAGADTVGAVHELGKRVCRVTFLTGAVVIEHLSGNRWYTAAEAPTLIEAVQRTNWCAT